MLANTLEPDKSILDLFRDKFKGLPKKVYREKLGEMAEILGYKPMTIYRSSLSHWVSGSMREGTHFSFHTKNSKGLFELGRTVVAFVHKNDDNGRIIYIYYKYV